MASRQAAGSANGFLFFVLVVAVFLTLAIFGCTDFGTGQREKEILVACGEACGRIEETSTTSEKKVYPCVESVSFTLRAGSSDVVCRCVCLSDGGVPAERIWR